MLGNRGTVSSITGCAHCLSVLRIRDAAVAGAGHVTKTRHLRSLRVADAVVYNDCGPLSDVATATAEMFVVWDKRGLGHAVAASDQPTRRDPDSIGSKKPMNDDERQFMRCLLRLYPAHGGPPLVTVLHDVVRGGVSEARAEAALSTLVSKGVLELATAGVGLTGPETLVLVTDEGARQYDQMEGESNE